MREIIRESAAKIKFTLSNFVSKQSLFGSWFESLKDKKEQILLSIVIIFVALSSFALGRYSLKDESNAEADTATTQKGNYQQKTVQTGLSSSNSNGSFVASKNGTKYYLTTCSGANKISQANKIYFTSEAEAQAKGYSRASNCSFWISTWYNFSLKDGGITWTDNGGSSGSHGWGDITS